MKSRFSNLTILSFAALFLFSCGNTNQPANGGAKSLTGDTATQQNRAPVDVRIKYGKTDGGSDCIGKGICSVGKITDTPPLAGSVPVHIAVDPTNSTILIFTFKETDLINAGRSDQDMLFRDPSHTYNFEAAYLLTDPIFDPLRLVKPNPRIDMTSPVTVQIMGDNITLRATYKHD
ncbi:MAG: hypothetical protein EBZ77_01215 [Chitinophagia bacterium]|nr:hypothetical protein [Chitinophagia bacterium]